MEKSILRMINTPILAIFENVETSLYKDIFLDFAHFLKLYILQKCFHISWFRQFFENVEMFLYRDISTFLDFAYFSFFKIVAKSL